MENEVVFLGNGINSFATAYSWDKLIRNLLKEFSIKSELYNESVAFPIVYEEIFLKAIKSKKIEEKQIKEFIAKDIKKLKPSSIHARIMSSKIKNIITTNYDYTLENSLKKDSRKLQNHGIVKESTFSLFRNIKVEDKIVWHAHGEVNRPRSIILGYEQYAGNLQAMRTYVLAGTKSNYKNFKVNALIRRLNEKNVYSWIDFFFKKNVHLVGLKLEFEEIDLWWLLTYRARFNSLNKKNSLKNKITYYIPKEFVNQSKAKITFLKTTGVEIKVIKAAHGKAYYNKVLDIIL